MSNADLDLGNSYPICSNTDLVSMLTRDGGGGSGRSTAPTASASSSSASFNNIASGGGGVGGYTGSIQRPASAGFTDDEADPQLLAGMSNLMSQGLVRSQSAAPAVLQRTSPLAAPPGLSNSASSSYSSGQTDSTFPGPIQLGRRRAASTGLIGVGMQQHPAFRPSAKTLMDLIQEDYPENDSLGAGGGQPLTCRIGDGAHSASSNSQSQWNGVPYGQQQQERLYSDASGQPLQQGRQHPDRGGMQQQQQQQHQPELQFQLESRGARGGFSSEEHNQCIYSMRPSSSNADQVRNQQTTPPDGPHHQQQYVASPFQVQTPSPPLQQQQQQQQSQFIFQQHAVVDGGGQQLFYGADAGQAQQQHLAQVIQQQYPGQPHTIVVNAAPGSQSQFGYATIQYHHGPPPPEQLLRQGQQQQQQSSHLVHQSIPGSGIVGDRHNHLQHQQQQQYVSIVPIGAQGSAANPQAVYWQQSSDGMSHQGVPNVANMGQSVAIMSSHTGAHMAVAGVPGGGQATVLDGASALRHHRQGGSAAAAVAVAAATSAGNSGGGDSRGGGRPSRDSRSGGARRRGARDPRRDGKHGTPHGAGSPLLDEFRAMKNRDWTMHQIVGHVVEFCQDQNGSRFIQQRLEMGDVIEQQIVVKEVLPEIRRLRNDVFGNYVVQKLFDFGSPQVKSDLRATLKGEMLQLSLQMYGCRVVQKALETLDEADLPGLLMEFHHNVLSCIHDQNGNHVIQKCIEVVSKRARKARSNGDEKMYSFLNGQIDFVIQDVLVNAETLSCHPYGCRVLQRVLEHCDQVRKTEVLDEIMLSHRKLLDDQYGNYVIQHVLQYGREVDRDSILEIVVESGLLRLARQKFASNVVEKLLKYGNGPQRRAVVREMLKVRKLSRETMV